LHLNKPETSLSVSGGVFYIWLDTNPYSIIHLTID
jgi:hypothetical protein